MPIPEILLILKTYTYESRKGTTKGKKDLIDVFSLLKKETIDWQKYQELINKHHLEKVNEQLKDLISSTKSLPELDLLNHKISRLKKKALAGIES